MAQFEAANLSLCDAGQLAELAPVSIICFDNQGCVTFVNEWHLRNVARGRRTRADFLGKSIFELPGIVNAGLAERLKTVLDGHIVQAENIFTSEFSGGQAGYQSLRAIPIMRDGALAGGIIIREDVTKYVLAEKRVTDSERKLKALLNASRDAAILVDTRGRLLALNETAAKQRGGDALKLLGESSCAFLPPEAARAREKHMDQVLRGKKPICFQEECDGRVSNVCIYPVQDETGEVYALAAFAKDVTDQLRREKELVRARIMAESANIMKSQFLANISHELRTPLNGILGMAQVGLAGNPDEEITDCLEVIRDSAVRLTNTINNLLDLADIEAGAIEPIVKEFDLAELMHSIANNFSVQAKLKGLSLNLSIATTVPPRVCGDEFRIRQTLVSLMSNALKCTSEGRINLSVTRPHATRPRPRSQVDLLFSVQDTGVGIEKDRMADIFDSFTLAEDVLTKRRSGVGIGLCIARNLVTLMGGKIGVQSQPGHGSRFFFTLRLAIPRAAPPQPEHSQPVGESLRRILLVEDEVINRLMTTTLLRRMGHTVFQAENGVEALRTLARENVDVILMDIQMPLMDGIETTQHIRHGEVPGLDKTVPVIALTAYAREKDRKRFLELGMDDFVPKPLVAEDLVRALEQSMAGRQPVPPGPPTV